VITNQARVLNRLLEFGPLRFFGRISYGLYIFHWPVYLLLYPYTLRLISKSFALSQKTAGIANATLLTTIGIGISVISYYTFEKYFLNLKKRFV
jgi:peptidoglycan/LPS O-acetylase OafA/YrhL